MRKTAGVILAAGLVLSLVFATVPGVSAQVLFGGNVWIMDDGFPAENVSQREDGTIVMKADTERNAGIALAETSYFTGDFTAEMKLKVPARGSSCVYFLGASNGSWPTGSLMIKLTSKANGNKGYEIYSTNFASSAGGFTNEGNGDKGANVSVTDWNTLKVEVTGNTAKITVNGAVVEEAFAFTRVNGNLSFGLGINQNPVDGTEFKDIKITVGGETVFTGASAAAPEQPKLFDPPYTETGSIKLLIIGNSFSHDARTWLWELLNATGRYDEIIIGFLYKGGGTLDQHYDYLTSGQEAYWYFYNDDGHWEMSFPASGVEALESQDWDVITLQQQSSACSDASSFSHLQDIIDIVKEKQPEAHICWHMTWAYQDPATADSMFAGITNNVKSIVIENESIKAVIPSGTVLHNIRSSYIGKDLYRDGTHLEVGTASYAAGLAFVKAITGYDINNIEWTPSGQPEVAVRLELIKKAVNSAMEKPYAVTDMSEEEDDGYDFTKDSELMRAAGLDADDYTEAELTWNSSYKYTAGNTGLRSDAFYFALQTFTRETLPVGSVVIVDDLYAVTPVLWKNGGNGAERTDITPHHFFVVNENFWGEYDSCGINVSMYSWELNVSYGNPGGVRIYIPKETASSTPDATASSAVSGSGISGDASDEQSSDSAGAGTGSNPDTGDMLGISAVMMMLCAAVLSVLIYRTRKAK